MIISSILLSTYLVDIITAFTEANKAILSYKDASGNVDFAKAGVTDSFTNALRSNSTLLDKFAAEFENIASSGDSAGAETSMQQLMQNEIILPIIKMTIATGVFQGIWGITNIVYGIVAKIKVSNAVKA